MTEAPGSLPDGEGWLRLHPLTPVARIGRLVPALVLLAVISVVHSRLENRTAETDYLVVLTLGSAVYGYIHWMVTRWRFEGDTLRIETGLIRRDSRRLPLARIQAVDIVRPLLARLLGVSELRVRLAGSGSTDGQAGLPGGGAGDRAAPPAAGRAPRARRAGLEQHGAPDGDGADRPPARIGPALPHHHDPRGHRRGAVGARPVRAAGRRGGGGLPRRLPAELRRHHLAPALGPVRLRRRRRTRGRAHQSRAPPDHLGDGPLPAHPGGAPGGAAPLAAVGLVPPGGRRGRGDGAQPAQRGHRRGAQGAAPGRVPAGRLAPPGPAARRARPAAHGAADPGAAEGPPQLPLPLGRPRRRPRRLRDRAHQPDDDLGAPGEDAECPPRAGTAAAPARAGDRPRGRRRQAHEGRVPGPRGGRGGPPRRRVGRSEPGGAPATPGIGTGTCGRERATPRPQAGIPDPSGRHERRYWHEGRWTAHVGDAGRRYSDDLTQAP